MSKIRRNQQTGTLIEVGTAEELGLDDEGGASKWYCVCSSKKHLKEIYFCLFGPLAARIFFKK